MTIHVNSSFKLTFYWLHFTIILLWIDEFQFWRWNFHRGTERDIYISIVFYFILLDWGGLSEARPKVYFFEWRSIFVFSRTIGERSEPYSFASWNSPNLCCIKIFSVPSNVRWHTGYGNDVRHDRKLKKSWCNTNLLYFTMSHS